MADEILDQVRDIVDGPIDFEGQRLNENLSVILLYSFSAIGVFIGYFLQDIRLALYIVLGGTAVTALVTIPRWPFYRNNPIKWLPVGSKGTPAQASIPQTLIFSDNVVGQQ